MNCILGYVICNKRTDAVVSKMFPTFDSATKSLNSRIKDRANEEDLLIIPILAAGA